MEANNGLKDAQKYLRTLAFQDTAPISDVLWKEQWKAFITYVKSHRFPNSTDGHRLFWQIQFIMDKFPELLKVYNRIITMTPSSATVERVHSMFTAILSKFRNRMSCATVIKLFMVKANWLFGANPRYWKSMFEKRELDIIFKEQQIFERFCRRNG